MTTKQELQNMTPAEMYLELAKAKRKLEIGVDKMLQAKEQEILKCIKSTLLEYIDDYKRNCGVHYTEEMEEEQAYRFIGENDEFLSHIKEYMELLYD